MAVGYESTMDEPPSATRSYLDAPDSLISARCRSVTLGKPTLTKTPGLALDAYEVRERSGAIGYSRWRERQSMRCLCSAMFFAINRTPPPFSSSIYHLQFYAHTAKRNSDDSQTRKLRTTAVCFFPALTATTPAF